MTDTITKVAEAIYEQANYCNQRTHEIFESECPYWIDVAKAALNELLNGEEVTGLIEAMQLIAGYATHADDCEAITCQEGECHCLFSPSYTEYEEALSAIQKLKSEVQE